VALLTCDLDNRLLELQRERGLTERLQKQLEDRGKQQEELKLILSQQQQNTTTILAGHENIIGEVLNAGADRGTRYVNPRTFNSLTNFIGWTNA
jgi:hypothetical protein